MRVTKILTSSVTAAALAFSMLASALPANAATTPGYHAAWVAQSAYATAAPGQVVQMSAVYQNTGDQPWIKGTAGQQANFAAGSAKDPAYPRDTTAYSDKGWGTGQNWLAANRFAAQANDLVATTGLGSWVWSVKVPMTQAAGVINFNGTPVVDGSAWMEDYGFFIQVTVTAGTVSVDSTSPASPANTAAGGATPQVNGSGAPAGSTVTLYDGATAVGTGTANSLGGFSIVTSALAQGTHTFSASAADSTGAFFASKNTLTYIYDNAAPTVTSVTARDALNLIVVFSKPVTSASAQTAGNYVNTPANASTAASLGSDKMTVTVTLTTPLANPSGNTLAISGVVDLAANTMTATSVPYTFNDTDAPTVVSASATVASGGTTAATVAVTWSEAVCGTNAVLPCTGASTTYSVDGLNAASISGASVAKITVTPASTSGLTAGSTHTVCSVGERDIVGLLQSPTAAACATFTVAAAAATTPLQVVSAAQGSTDNKILVTWNQNVTTASTGTYTATYPGGGAGPALTAAAPTGASPIVTLTVGASPFGAGACAVAATTSCTLTISVSGQLDANGTLMSPPVQTFQALLTKDTTAPTVVSAVASGAASNGQSTITLTFSKTLSAVAAGSYSVANSSTSSASCGTPCTGLTLTVGFTAPSSTVTLTRPGVGVVFAAGTYTITVGAGGATDASFSTNTNAAQTISITVVDQTPPTLTTFTAPACTSASTCTTFTFVFSKAMKTGAVAGSVTDITNYTLDGAAITGFASATVGATTTVTLTLSAAPSVAAHNFKVMNVQDTSGNVLSPTPSANLPFTRTG